MQLRRALTAGALVLSLGALSSCGFDLATDRPYTPGVGTIDRSGQVDVLAAVVVAAQPNQGTFVVTLVNKDPEKDAALNGLSSPDIEVAEFKPIELAPREAVNLADEGGITLSGDFDAGQILPLTLSYANGDTTELNVPVVTACGAYEGLDLTEGSEFIPYDCEYEPPAPGESADEPAGESAEETE